MVSPARALETAISFSAQDLAIFSEASGDRNPLPLDQEYARRTPYGQQLVFGCLGAIACLNRIHLPTSWAVSWLQVEFLRPMFLGVSYRLETSENEGHWVARLFDGTLPVVALSVKAGPCRRKHVRDLVGHFRLQTAASGGTRTG